MWFLTMLSNMADRYLPEPDRASAQRFINELVICFASAFYEDDIPMELKLGVVDKFFHFLRKAEKEKHPITLPIFAQELFGFLIVYAKYIDEQVCWLSDFTPLLTLAPVYKALGAEQDEGSIFEKMIGDLPNNGMTAESLSKDQLEYMAERARICNFRNIETNTLGRLNWSLSLDFHNLRHLFRRPWNTAVRTPFVEECRSMTFAEPRMEELIKVASTVPPHKRDQFFSAPVDMSEPIEIVIEDTQSGQLSP